MQKDAMIWKGKHRSTSWTHNCFIRTSRFRPDLRLVWVKTVVWEPSSFLEKSHRIWCIVVSFGMYLTCKLSMIGNDFALVEHRSLKFDFRLPFEPQKNLSYKTGHLSRRFFKGVALHFRSEICKFQGWNHVCINCIRESILTVECQFKWWLCWLLQYIFPELLVIFEYSNSGRREALL